MLRNARLALSIVLPLVACVGQQPPGSGDGSVGDDDGGGGGDVDATPETPPDTSVHVPSTSCRRRGWA
jgi:hypothetical protein